MGFFSFAGRVLFASVFILSAWQEFNEFGVNGGPAAKAWEPKLSNFAGHVSTNLGIPMPHIEAKHLVAAMIAFKGIGGVFFIIGSSLGAYLLVLHLLISTPILYDVYNYDIRSPEFAQYFVKWTQNIALLGALLFFLGMKNSLPRRQPKKKPNKAKTN